MEGKKICFIGCLKASHEDPESAIANAKTLANEFMLGYYGKTYVAKNKLANSFGETKLSCVSQSLPNLLDLAILQIQDSSSIGAPDTLDSLLNWNDDDSCLSE